LSGGNVDQPRSRFVLIGIRLVIAIVVARIIRHAGAVNAELSGFLVRRRHDCPAWVEPPTTGLPMRRVVAFLDGGVEGVHIDVDKGCRPE